jgi:hypothetical protein
MEEILDTLKTLVKKMETLEERLIRMERVIPACERMDDHVTFVNGVYTTMKAPIEYVCSAFTRTDTKLPSVSSSDTGLYLNDDE